MTQATLTPGPGSPDGDTRPADGETGKGSGLIAGRPIEDRSFELVEVTAGAAAGVLIGGSVAGPAGMLIGGVAGAAAGLLGGEAVERHAGRAATTTDATDKGAH